MRSPDLKALLLALLITAGESTAVILTEIMFNPNGDEGADEFIELYNETTLPQTFTGWTISDGEDSDTLISMGMGLTAGPGQYVLIFDPNYEEESTSYDGLVPETALVLTISNSTFGGRGLSNSSAETITIRTQSGTIAAQHAYDIETPAGHSTEKILLSGDDSAANWTSSISVNGTPGGRNSATPPNQDLAIMEFFADPAYPGSGEAFHLSILVENRGLFPRSDSLLLFEVSNGDSGQSLQLAGWHILSLPPDSSIEKNEPLIMGSESPRKFRAMLKTPDDVPSNNSMTLNVGSSAASGDLLFNEIMYRPSAGRSEWIEIANPQDASIELTGWSFADGNGIADSLERVSLDGLTIAAGGYALLAADSFIQFEFIPDSIPIVIWHSSSPSLNNNGDSLLLYDGAGQIVDRVDYRANWGDDAAGRSLERVSLASPSNNPLNWASSLDSTGGSPGRVNSRSLLAETGDALLELSPNPFSPNDDGHDDLLAVRYRLEHPDSRLDIKIFDARGREVKRLADNRAAGYQGEILWDGRANSGRELPTGLYVIYLEALGQGGERIQSAKRAVALVRPS